MSRRLIALCVLLAAVSLDAAPKRRSARAPGGSATSNNCHTFGFVRVGLRATYLTVAPGGNVNYTITYLEDTATRARTTQQVTTPQGSANVETTIDVEQVGLLRGMKHTKVATSINVPGAGNVTTTVDLDFVPSLILGPAQGWCVDATWDIPPVTETITTTSPFAPPVNNTVVTVASTGKVLAVGEMITVPAGQFETVKYRGVTTANNTVSPTITWVSMEHNGIVVRQDTLDAAGAVTSTTTLTALQFQ